MALVEVKVPDIGDFKDVAVIELLVKPGDSVKAEQSLITVESDKASMEIPSSSEGVVKEIRLKVGDVVNQGTLILVLESGAVAAAAPTQSTIETMTPAVAPAVQMPNVGTTSVEVAVPDIGDFDSVTVIEVFVKPGDAVRVEQSLVTVESDKASMEIPSSHAGVVKALKVKLGDKIAKGSPLLTLEVAGAVAAAPASAAPVAAPAASATTAAARHVPPTAALPAQEPAAPAGQLPHASPSIRRLAREFGVALGEVSGSGPNGRITEVDLQAYVKRVMSGERKTSAQHAQAPAATAGAGSAMPGLLPWPQVDFAKFGPVERQDLSRIKRIAGANLHRNWVLIPHVTNHDDADITDLEAFRVELNNEKDSPAKVTMLAFMIKAAVASLKKFPTFNASLDGEQLVLKSYFHIGFAADTPNGLVVPVIKDADKKGIFEISAEMGELAKKAREGKLGPADMSGGCFTISSLGGIGGRYFTPIINAPEVAIMGVCRSTLEPKWDGQQFKPRLMLPLSLSWDHRVIDGAAAARFNVYFASLLADFRRITL